MTGRQQEIKGLNEEDTKMKMPDYEQVKNRVNRETEVLPGLVLWTGIGMAAAIIISVFIFRWTAKPAIPRRRPEGARMKYKKQISDVLQAEKAAEELSPVVIKSGDIGEIPAK